MNILSNEHIVQFLEDILDGLIFEIYFEKDLHEKNIKFIEYLNDLVSIENLSNNEIKKILSDLYVKLNETKNPIRNNLMLLHIEIDYLKPILKV